MITQIFNIVIQDAGQMPKKEDTMDKELRELLEKANVVWFLGGDPRLILWQIEELAQSLQ